jgi:hypothetical protein
MRCGAFFRTGEQIIILRGAGANRGHFGGFLCILCFAPALAGVL